MRFNHIIAVLKSDGFLNSQESNVIDCYNNKFFSLLSPMWNNCCTAHCTQPKKQVKTVIPEISLKDPTY